MQWDPLIKDVFEALNTAEIPLGIRTEEHFERCFVEPIVRRIIGEQALHRHLEIATHPWIKPDTPKPHSEEIRARVKRWGECKQWANVTAWGLTHTLDIFVRDTSPKGADDMKPPQDCITIEVKFCKEGKPTGDFQRMIGQSVLFLGRKDHKAVVAVIGYRGDAWHAPGNEPDIDTIEMGNICRALASGRWFDESLDVSDNLDRELNSGN